jgi:hypothetical protein
MVLHDFGFYHLNLCTNLRVLIQLEYLQPIDVRHRDLVAQDMQRVENTHWHEGNNGVTLTASVFVKIVLPSKCDRGVSESLNT